MSGRRPLARNGPIAEAAPYRAERQPAVGLNLPANAAFADSVQPVMDAGLAPTWPGDYHRLFDDPDRDQTGGAIVRPTPSRLHQLEDDGIVTEQRGQLRWVARIDLVELLGDVTTSCPQNSFVALDC